MGDKVNRCVLLGASPGCTPEFLLGRVEPDDFLICADAGYQIAEAAGLLPDLLLGDFDTAPPPERADVPILRYQAEKDETDMLLALRAGLKRGYRDFLILGGLGARLDHTIANLFLLVEALEHGAHAVLIDERTTAMALRNGSVIIPRQAGTKLSVFPWGGAAHGVTERGVKYPLDGYEMTPFDALGVSNQIEADTAEICVKRGTLLILLTRE